MRGVTLVIGSGGVKCAAALGVMRALDRAGIAVERVVGCSGGSIYAAALALGWSTESSIEMTRNLWTREITKRRSTRALLGILFPRRMRFESEFGLVDDRLVMQRLERAFGRHAMEDAKIPLFITATDFRTGEQVVLQSGSLVDAIRGSIAIPYIFRPWPVDGRFLIDGYMSDPLPIGAAIRNGAHAILAIGFEATHQTRVTTLLRFAFQLSSVASNNLLRANFAFYNAVHHDEIIPIVPEFEDRIGLFDVDKLESIIAAGERAAEAEIPYLQRHIQESTA